MDKMELGRRGALSGGLAATLVVMPDLAGGHGKNVAAAEVEEAACHAPFRAAFLAWIREASERFALPVSAYADSTLQTKVHVPGLHPALEIVIDGDTDINIFVTWKGVFWDILASMDVHAELAANGDGWHSTMLIPTARRLHPTREACWRADGFEWLLEWLNEELTPATHLALYGGEGCYEERGWTSAHLARDGILIPSGRSLESNGPLRELLPLRVIKS